MNELHNLQAGNASTQAHGVTERKLRLDRRFLAFTLLATILLSWPLLAFSRPSYIQDSAAYYKGGRAAVTFVMAKVQGLDVSSDGQVASAPGLPAPPPEHSAKKASGVRSITYSVATYLLSAPATTLILLTIFQALCAAIVIVATLGAFGGLPTRRTAISLVLIASATTVAPASYLAVPDIFAGLLIGAMVLLIAAWTRLSLGIRLLCTGIAAFAVTAHASHIPLAAGMTALGLGWVAVKRFYFHDPLPRWTWAWVVAPLLIGGMTTVAVNRVAFGETSLTSKRYPFALARSVNDGPARWYLEKHCPELKYTICTLYPNGLPKGGALEFLWGPDGIVNVATAEQLDRIRAEEPDIVLAAAKEYSWFEVRRISYNIIRQLVSFRPYPYEANLVLDESGTPQLNWSRVESPVPLHVISILTAISVALATLWLGWTFIKERELRPVIALLFLGILGNAVTCTVLSAVAQRYQARVIWLIPLLALALYGAIRDRRATTA
ncbi:hypothetical protein [Sphingomonas daechungensis]|uniref:hypothetical protein n=1 Tax=Sphingomonas daechungensis TaxID=1176646 RepID=UPI00378446A0